MNKSAKNNNNMEMYSFHIMFSVYLILLIELSTTASSSATVLPKYSSVSALYTTMSQTSLHKNDAVDAIPYPNKSPTRNKKYVSHTPCNHTITKMDHGSKYAIVISTSSNNAQNNESSLLNGTNAPNTSTCSMVTPLKFKTLRVYWQMNGTGDVEYFQSNSNGTGIEQIGNVSWNNICISSSTMCNLTITKLNPGEAYTIEIFTSADGVRNRKFYMLRGTTMPSEPTEYQVLERTPYNFTITWKNGTGYIDFYRVNCSCSSPNNPGSPLDSYSNLDPGVSSYTSIKLDPGTCCTLKIYAVVGNKKILSLPLSGHATTNETAPGPVTNFSIANVTSASVRINWLPPSERNGVIRGYHLSLEEKFGYCLENPRSIQNCTLSNHSEVVKDSICQDNWPAMTMANCPTTKFSNMGSFLLENLNPYVNYSIGLRAYTSKLGHQTVLHTTTAHTMPHQPTNVSATGIGPREISVIWDSPKLCTGSTSYSLNFIDTVHMVKKNITCTDTSQTFRLTKCIIRDLEEYWEYKIEVMATVAGFPSNVSTSVLARTLESTPGPIEQLILTPGTNLNVYPSIIVSWRPPIMRERNGVILFYRIAYYQFSSDVVELFQKFDPNETQHFIQLDNLTAERIYFVNISANTSIGYGEIVQKNTTTKSVAPLLLDDPLKQSTEKVTDPRNQIAVDLPLSNFLCNTASGFPRRWGVVVSQHSKAKDKPFRGNSSDFQTKLLNYKSWRDIKDEDDFPPYRATYNEWKPIELCLSPARTKRLTGTHAGPDYVSFVIGQDEDCADSVHQFCNGYLKPNTEYSVRVYVCTSEGCTESMWSPPIRTDKDSTIVTIVVSVILLVLLLFGIVIVVILKIRRMLSYKVYRREDPETNTCQNRFDIRGFNIKIQRPIKLSEIKTHVEMMHKCSVVGFSSEYKLLKEIEPKYSTEVANSEACRSKNRYTNILPYDHSRVKLIPIEDKEGSDYINASYIQGYKSKRDYISTQGPLPETRDDFWRMVWEQNAEIIVMLTKCIENGRVKCDKYWPDVNEPIYHGDLKVNVTSESIFSDYIIRDIELLLTQTTRKVLHCSFLNWPDMGCPTDPATLLNFVTSIRMYVKPNSQSPIVVHCSAGVGRTGTFIAVDHLMQHVLYHDEVDIFNLVYEMRKHRCNMVQTEDQYVYIHDTILEFVTGA